MEQVVADYTYNLRGRMARVEIDSDPGNGHIETTLDYAYDSRGTRVQEVTTTDDGTTQTSTTVNYVIDSNNPTGYSQTLEERDASGGITRTYVLGHDVLTQHDHVLNQVMHLLYDAHGSTRALIDALARFITSDPNATPGSGDEVLQLFTYDAYGNPIGFENAMALTTLLYSGEAMSAASGLQYLRARWMSPGTGRFTRVDPFAGFTEIPVTLHRYAYAHSSPVDLQDPSGLSTMTMDELMLVVGGIGVIMTFIALQSAVQQRNYAHSTIGVIGVLETLLDSSISGAEQTISDIVHNLSGFAALVADAKAIAIAAGKTIVKQIPNIPIYVVPEDLTPTIYRDTVRYQIWFPRYYVLSYMANPVMAATNRGAALRGRGRAGTLMSWDEFPYASTFEGGAGSFVAAVWWHENAVQGGLLGAFYRIAMKGAPGPFLVLPVPAILRGIIP